MGFFSFKLRKRHVVGLFFVSAVAALYWVNASGFARLPMSDGPQIMAHRGLGQQYHREGLTRDSCTATMLKATPHRYLENTLAGIEAAFAVGAKYVEVDLHPTTDGQFALFHDWRLECRTQAKGPARERSMQELRLLDVGYGYTFDGGKTYPFRGQGKGGIPSLEDLLAKFPTQRFVLDLKGNTHEEGQRLVDRLASMRPDERARFLIYGGKIPVQLVQRAFPSLPTAWPQRLKNCIKTYAAFGWSGFVPRACRNAMIMLPRNIAVWMWGWPNRFLIRMRDHGSVVFLLDRYQGEGHSTPLDDLSVLPELPRTSLVNIWTDRADAWAAASNAGQSP